MSEIESGTIPSQSQRDPVVTLFGLLRHGTTLWNEQKRIQGQENSPLSADGIKRTETWSKFLSSQNWDQIVASDLGRVQETVAILNRNLDLPVTWDKRLREQNWGLWQGMKLCQIEETYPEVLEQQVSTGWQFTPPKGESRIEVHQRAQSALFDASHKWNGKNILVVCHQGVLKCLLYSITSRSFLPQEECLIQKDMLQMIVHREDGLRTHKLNISPDDSQL